MADTRLVELEKDRETTQAGASVLMGRLEAITIQITEMQEQSSQQWKGVQTQLGVLWKKTSGWTELNERKKQAEVWREEPQLTRKSGIIRKDSGKSLPNPEFPDFDGSSLEDWVYRSCRYFDREQSPEERKVRIASVHMYGKALQWHYAFIRNRRHSDLPLWKEYVEALTKRFGKAGNRFMVNNLKHEGGNDNSNVYMEEFESYRMKGLERAEWSEKVQIRLASNELKGEYTTQLLGVQSEARLFPTVTQSEQVQKEAGVIIGPTRGFPHSIAPFPNVRVQTGRENLLARRHGVPSHAPRHDEGGGNLQIMRGRGRLSPEECNEGRTEGLFVQTALVDFYGEFGEVGIARKLINEMLVRNVFAWSTLISIYSLVSDMVFARYLFDRLPERKTTMGNSLIEGYSRMSEGEMAESLFESMTKRDVISWMTMITCYYYHNRSYGEALALVEEITSQEIMPEEVCLTTIFSACASLSTLVVGREIHCYLMQNQLRVGIFIGSVMVDMYAKYEELATSLWVFYKLQERNLFGWNSTIEGLVMHSHAKQVLMMLGKMEKVKVKPNGATFISISSACSLARLVEEGRIRFQSMTKDYLISSGIEHYGCMVNLLSKAGLLEEVWARVNNMMSLPNSVIWGAWFAGCKNHKNLDIAWIAIDTLKELEPNNNGHHALLLSMYTEPNRLGRSAQNQIRVSAHAPNFGRKEGNEMADSMEGADKKEVGDVGAEINVEADDVEDDNVLEDKEIDDFGKESQVTEHVDRPEETNASENSCVVEELENLLNDSGHLHALAVLYANKGRSSNALAIWRVPARNYTSLLRETGSRYAHQTRSYILTGRVIAATEGSEILQACSNQHLILQYFGWISDINQILAVNILTSEKRGKQLSPADVLVAIDPKKVENRQRYLQWLIEDQNSNDTQFHTIYAVSLAKSALYIFGAEYRVEEALDELVQFFIKRLRSLVATMTEIKDMDAKIQKLDWKDNRKLVIILHRKMIKRGRRATTNFPTFWNNSSQEGAIWEGASL